MVDWVDVGGASLRYDLAGDGSAILVLIHELGGTLESWDEVLPYLTPQFRVLRYDQRGFGMSERTTFIDMSQITSDLAGLLDALQITQRCHFAGTAMGAAIALCFAMRYPGRTESVVAASPAIGIKLASVASLQARMEIIEQGGMRASVDATMNASYAPPLRTDPRRFQRYRARWLANDPESFIALNRMTAEMDMEPDLSQVKAPTLLVGCTADPFRPPEDTRKISAQIPNSKFVVADSGHFMAVQTPELFAQVALPFLNQHRSAADGGLTLVGVAGS